ncbi:melatonin receptor type 1B-like [Paramacrobiotus metropolitanus]|uniref:melatonin receptor type 1B-like n=1 Tax=Paramacrobiotus metropolitanus TaxID=2943436 RepID=UPI002446384D|nr:melatonin receptor type 1B-like [Paramacrobiotus metropolitanus]
MVNDTKIPVAAQWTFVPIFATTILIAVLLTNTPVLIQLLLRPHLRTAFNIYLVNLLIANLLLVVFQNPLDILEALYSGWWMGWKVCNLYIYANYVLGGVIMLTHVLIAVNRIWAVTFPVHYRHKHTKCVALGICLVSWMWIHLLILPGIITDALYYRKPVESFGCQVNNAAQAVWAMTMHWVLYVLPTPFILASFPYVIIKQMRHKRLVHSRLLPTDAGGNEKRPSRTATENRNMHHADSVNAASTENKEQKRSKGMLIFALLTASIFFTWTPGRVYFTIKLYTSIDNNLAFQICYVLFACQSALDPLLFIVALKDLRGMLTPS